MHFVSGQDAVEHQNSEHCIAYEYPTEDQHINVAIVEVSGRYPDSGFVFNEVCREQVLLVSGGGKMVSADGTKRHMTSRDAVLILPGERYYWEGELELCIASTPAWYPEQHHTEAQ